METGNYHVRAKNTLDGITSKLGISDKINIDLEDMAKATIQNEATTEKKKQKRNVEIMKSEATISGQILSGPMGVASKERQEGEDRQKDETLQNLMKIRYPRIKKSNEPQDKIHKENQAEKCYNQNMRKAIS